MGSWAVSSLVILVTFSILYNVKTLRITKFCTAGHGTNAEANRRIVKTLQSLHKNNVQVLLLLVLVGMVFLFISLEFVEIAEALQIRDKIHHVNENQREYTIDTVLPWRLVEGDVLHVSILNADDYPEVTEIIKNVIFSEQVIKFDYFEHKGSKDFTHTYYDGWKGALEAASSEKTDWYIPVNFDIVESLHAHADIVIDLKSVKSVNGNSANTKIIADDIHNQLLKVHITIYEVDQQSLNSIRMITAHEMGHALGLGHSTEPKDIMSSPLQSNHPFISECNVNALVAVYSGNINSRVTC